ncbi:uncharacterized protein V6R79_018718 [Siganus canaliculatus]
MEESEKGPELKRTSENSCQPLNPDVTVNQIFHTVPHHGEIMSSCYMGVNRFCQKLRVGRATRELSQFAFAVQHEEPMQHQKPDSREAAPASDDLHQQPPESYLLQAARNMECNTRKESWHLNCGSDWCETAEPANRGTAWGGDYSFSDDEDLEAPLPLRSDEEWQDCNPFGPPHHSMLNYGLQHAMDVRCYHAATEAHFNCSPTNIYPSHSCHWSDQHTTTWDNSHNWLQCHSKFMTDSMAQWGVSVNVPQFSIPPTESTSQVSMKRLNSAGTEEFCTHHNERRQTVSVPDVCRNVFITYSSDVSSEIMSFADFLTQRGFYTAMDKWKDSYLTDPSTLIIIAISPKYKADIEGSVLDSHGQQTRYMYTLNTHVYRWPQDTEDFLLRLFKEERYVPPPVSPETTLIIRPVAPSSAATL